MRAVRGAAGPIHQERFVGGEGFVLAQPGDRVIREVLAQVIIVVAAGRVGMLDIGGVADELRFVLRRLSGEEPVEVFEAVAGGPVVERAGGGRLLRGRIVPFAPRGSVIAVILEYFGDRGAALGDHTHVAIPVIGQLRDLAAGDAVMVAPVSNAARVGEHIAVV